MITVATGLQAVSQVAKAVEVKEENVVSVVNVASAATVVRQAAVIAVAEAAQVAAADVQASTGRLPRLVLP